MSKRVKTSPPPWNIIGDAPLSRLPIEVKLYILSYCDLFSFYALATSCRAFYSIYATGSGRAELAQALRNGMCDEAWILHKALNIQRAKEKWLFEQRRDERLQRYITGSSYAPGLTPPDTDTRRVGFSYDAYGRSYAGDKKWMGGTFIEELVDMQTTTRYFARLFQRIGMEGDRLRVKKSGKRDYNRWMADVTICATSEVREIERVFYDVWLSAFTAEIPRSDRARLRFAYEQFETIAHGSKEYRRRYGNMAVVRTFLDGLIDAVVMAAAPVDSEEECDGLRTAVERYPIYRRMWVDRAICERYGRRWGNLNTTRTDPLLLAPTGGQTQITKAAFAAVDGGRENFVGRNDLLQLNRYDGTIDAAERRSMLERARGTVDALRSSIYNPTECRNPYRGVGEYYRLARAHDEARPRVVLDAISRMLVDSDFYSTPVQVQQSRPLARAAPKRTFTTRNWRVADTPPRVGGDSQRGESITATCVRGIQVVDIVRFGLCVQMVCRLTFISGLYRCLVYVCDLGAMWDVAWSTGGFSV